MFLKFIIKNMEKIKNIEKYNSGMAKSIKDKLWFTQFLEQSQFNNAIIVDYGCGNGTLIRELEHIFPCRFSYYGVDNNEEMLKLAYNNRTKSGIGVFTEYCKNVPQIITDRPKILILSSVLHEILSYGNWNSLEEIRSFQPDYIFIRDMYVDESIYRRPSKKDLNKISKHPQFTEYFKYHQDFDDQLQILDFLLKYRYIENWDREVKEDYTSLRHYDIINDLFRNYNIIYKKQYILPFLKNKVMEDFGINLVDNTHINLILKRNDSKRTY